MQPTHLTRQELYEELGKAQSRDSNTTNKKLRKEIVELKENVERLEGVNKTIAQERERYKQRMCELEAESDTSSVCASWKPSLSASETNSSKRLIMSGN